MKKFNRTYVMGALCLLLAAWIVWQTGKVPMRLVAREPGPASSPIFPRAVSPCSPSSP